MANSQRRIEEINGFFNGSVLFCRNYQLPLSQNTIKSHETSHLSLGS